MLSLSPGSLLREAFSLASSEPVEAKAQVTKVCRGGLRLNAVLGVFGCLGVEEDSALFCRGVEVFGFGFDCSWVRIECFLSRRMIAGEVPMVKQI